MTFTQARNAIVQGLEAHIGCPVNLTDQIAEQPDYPYCYYSVLAPRITNHAFGLREVLETGDDTFAIRRTEPAAATMSFTFCSQNRETEDGYIFGEDEALELSEKAHGFFLLNGHNIHTEFGDIVINSVSSVGSRTGFVVEDAIRRYGFDIRFSYMRTDEMPTEIIEKANPVGITH